MPVTREYARPLRVTIHVPGKLFTTNGERKMNRYTRADKVKEWREAFAATAKAIGVEHFPRAIIVAAPVQKRRPLADVGAHAPVVKAAIDGLVDAGVLTNDTPAYLPELHYLAPIHGGSEHLSLTIIETEAPCD